MTAFLLKDHVAPDVYQTIAGLRVTRQIIDDGAITIDANGIFTGSSAETVATDRALAKCPRPYELSFDTGRRLRGKFRIRRMSYRGDFNGERNYDFTLESVGTVETVR